MKRALPALPILALIIFFSGCSPKLYQPASREVDDVYYLPTADAEPAVSTSYSREPQAVPAERGSMNGGIANPDYQPNSDAGGSTEYYQSPGSRLAPENNPYYDDFEAYREGYRNGYQDAYWQMSGWGSPFMGNPWYSPYGWNSPYNTWSNFYYNPAWGWRSSWGLSFGWGNGWRYSPWYSPWYGNCWNCWYGNQIYVTGGSERPRSYYAPRRHLTPRGTTFQQQNTRSTISTQPVQQNPSRQGRTRYSTTPNKTPTYTPRYRNSNTQQRQSTPRYRSTTSPRSTPSYNRGSSPSRSGGGRSRPR
ncbi:MAG: hypothetical protein KatS3mg033_1546 [Thermonema sp.]|uniref:hypothetical protein n=1 Tax=Thermonema sp. TaxID=2231181 RepID=UPI0021DD9A43|nr:hypothetical protein [Thermonema sp.]GIV39746.1 MAG: hypothetical protein KatS3mg033_1546 [Thermonema sp.]